MKILVLAEHNGRHLKKSTRQIVTAAQAWGLPVHVLIAGHQIADCARAAAGLAGVAEVLKVDAPHLAHVLAEDLAAILATVGREYRVILGNHAPYARNALARTAALLDVGMISDVIRIDGTSTYTHPVYAGSILETVESTDAIHILTVRANAFTEAGQGDPQPIIEKQAPPALELSCWLSEERREDERPELASARIIVAGGRALGTQFTDLLQPLADKLGAAIGASRSAVDAGHAANDIQIGQTGVTVAPDLYLAIGISGAIQHLAGIKDSKVIVAINHDPEAPIFKVADYGLVADLNQALPELYLAL